MDWWSEQSHRTEQNAFSLQATTSWLRTIVDAFSAMTSCSTYDSIKVMRCCVDGYTLLFSGSVWSTLCVFAWIKSDFLLVSDGDLIEKCKTVWVRSAFFLSVFQQLLETLEAVSCCLEADTFCTSNWGSYITSAQKVWKLEGLLEVTLWKKEFIIMVIISPH